VTPLVAAAVLLDHVLGLRSEGWSPVTAALAFAGLALLAGAVVVIIVTVLTRRNDAPPR
jgi:hypothetical protein